MAAPSSVTVNGTTYPVTYAIIGLEAQASTSTTTATARTSTTSTKTYTITSNITYTQTFYVPPVPPATTPTAVFYITDPNTPDNPYIFDFNINNLFECSPQDWQIAGIGNYSDVDSTPQVTIIGYTTTCGNWVQLGSAVSIPKNGYLQFNKSSVFGCANIQGITFMDTTAEAGHISFYFEYYSDYQSRQNINLPYGTYPQPITIDPPLVNDQ